MARSAPDPAPRSVSGPPSRSTAIPVAVVTAPAQATGLDVREDLRACLTDSGLEEAIPLFIENQVLSLRVARSNVTEGDLEDWGIKAVPRRAILRALRGGKSGSGGKSGGGGSAGSSKSSSDSFA